MEHDLRQPLRRRSLIARIASARPSALRSASFTCIAGLAGLATWLVISHEPYGGEPVVHMRIDTSDPIVTSSLSDQQQRDNQPASQENAATEDAADNAAETGSDTPVIDLSELGSRDDETDLARRQREMEEGRLDDSSSGDVQSPPGALSIDDLATSREAGIPARADVSLVPAPVDAITTSGPHGPLPRVGSNGARAASVYARPVSRDMFNSDAPKIALLIGGMGLNPALTRTAIQFLPPEVSLAFAPYGEDLQMQANAARASGHELFIQLPMEPFGYPSVDPGPRTLLTSAPAAQNLDSLKWHLSRFSGYAGVTNYLGAQFVNSDAATTPILQELGKRGLIYVDDGSKGLSRATKLASANGLQARSAMVNLDESPSMPAALEQLEALARQNGVAIATGSGLPETIEAIDAWAKGLASRNIMLIPVTAAFATHRS